MVSLCLICPTQLKSQLLTDIMFDPQVFFFRRYCFRKDLFTGFCSVIKAFTCSLFLNASIFSSAMLGFFLNNFSYLRLLPFFDMLVLV